MFLPDQAMKGFKAVGDRCADLFGIHSKTEAERERCLIRADLSKLVGKVNTVSAAFEKIKLKHVADFDELDYLVSTLEHKETVLLNNYAGTIKTQKIIIEAQKKEIEGLEKENLYRTQAQLQ